MKKNTLLLIFSCLFYLSSLAQVTSTQLSYVSTIPNVNISATLPSNPVSYKVNFDVINGNLVLIDSFESNIGLVDSFTYHVSNGTLSMDNYYANGGFNFCLYSNFQSSNYSAHKVKFTLVPLSSFTQLNVVYNNQNYTIQNVNNTSVTFSPDEFLVENYTAEVNLRDVNFPPPCEFRPLFEIQNNKLIMNYYATHDLCALQFYRSERINDSIELDSRFACSTQCALGESYGCYSIEISDTNFTELHVFHKRWITVFKQSNGAISYHYDFPVSKNELTLSAFKGVENNTLKWEFNSDFTIKHFELFVSTDNVTFEKLIEVNNTQYQYIHYTNKEHQYYKVYAVSPEGQIMSSNTTYVSRQSIPNKIVVSPNPASQFATITLPFESNYNIELVNSIGLIVGRYSATSSIKIFRNNLPKGIYFLHLVNQDNGHKVVQKIVFN